MKTESMHELLEEIIGLLGNATPKEAKTILYTAIKRYDIMIDEEECICGHTAFKHIGRDLSCYNYNKGDPEVCSCKSFRGRAK